MDSENKFTYTFNQKVTVAAIDREYDSYLINYSS